MAKHDYVPSTEPEQSVWAGTIKTQIAIHGATVGMTSGEITDAQTDCDNVTGPIHTFSIAKGVFQQATSTKNAAKNPAIKNLRTMAQRIKKNAGYTTAIGEALRIIGDEQTVDVPNSLPVLVHAKVPSGHEFKFNLFNFFDGVNIYKKLPAATGFTFLARDTHSPYIDTATVESGTQYYAYFVEGDTEVGQQSAIINVSV